MKSFSEVQHIFFNGFVEYSVRSDQAAAPTCISRP